MGGKTVLVVDDNEDVRYTIIRGLESLEPGFELKDAPGGADCISLLESGYKPDVILLDIMMPDMDGWEVAARISQNESWKDIPIIFLTAKTDDISKGLGGVVARDYICKPFDMVDLITRIKKMWG